MAASEVPALRGELGQLRELVALVVETASIKKELDAIRLGVSKLKGGEGVLKVEETEADREASRRETEAALARAKEMEALLKAEEEKRRKAYEETRQREIEERRQRAEALAAKRREEDEKRRKEEIEKRKKREEEREAQRLAAERAHEEERKRIQAEPLRVPEYGLQQAFKNVAPANVIFLPPDLWVNCLKGCSAAHLLRVVARLSKTFNYGAQTDSLWKLKFSLDFAELFQRLSNEERTQGGWLARYKSAYMQYYGSLALEMEPTVDLKTKARGCKLKIINKADVPLQLQPLGIKLLIAINGGLPLDDGWSQKTCVIFPAINKDMLTIPPKGTLEESYVIEFKVGTEKQNEQKWACFLRPVKAKDPQWVDLHESAAKMWQYKFCFQYSPELLKQGDSKVPLPECHNCFKGVVTTRVLVITPDKLSFPFKPVAPPPYRGDRWCLTSCKFDKWDWKSVSTDWCHPTMRQPYRPAHYY